MMGIEKGHWGTVGTGGPSPSSQTCQASWEIVALIEVLTEEGIKDFGVQPLHFIDEELGSMRNEICRSHCQH